MFHAPGIDSTDRAALFGEDLLRNFVLDKARIALKTAQVVAHINLFRKISHRLHRGLLRQPISEHLADALGPILAVTLQNVWGNLWQRLAIDFHDHSMR